MRRWVPLLVAAALFATGCSEPVLDAAELDESIADVRSSLDESQRVAFDAAVDRVRQASAGEITGTDPFSLDGMTAEAVLAEAERIEIRRERAVEREAAAAQREILEAGERLARLRVVEFVAQPIGATRMEADLSVRNELEFPVDSAWLRVEVAIPDGPSRDGEEFVSFRPALAPGEQRTIRILVSGAEARSLPVEPPAELELRFVMAERGGELALQEPTAEERSRVEAELAETERRIAELDARLAAVGSPG